MQNRTPKIVNGVVYRIAKKGGGGDISDCYIGSTKCLSSRKNSHRSYAKSGRKGKLYDYIQENGGWSNFTVNTLEKVDYLPGEKHKLRAKELEYIELFKPILNTNKPTVSEKGHCPHGRIRSQCRDCGTTTRMCEHGRVKAVCRLCKGSQICEHGRVKFICRDCGGSLLCEHSRQKYTCKDCAPEAYAKIKERAIERSRDTTIAICEHGKKQRRDCKICFPEEYKRGREMGRIKAKERRLRQKETAALTQNNNAE